MQRAHKWIIATTAHNIDNKDDDENTFEIDEVSQFEVIFNVPTNSIYCIDIKYTKV